MTGKLDIALSSFAKLDIGLEQLQRALEGVVRFRYADTNERDVEMLGDLPSVEFHSNDVEAALRGYLNGKLSSRDISDWAATIRLLDAYDVSARDDPDSVWDVLDQLASPDAWGSLTTESAIELIRQL